MVCDSLIKTGWFSNIHIGVGEIEFGIYVAENRSICRNDLLQLDLDKEVERVNVLLYKTFDFEKSW